MLYEDVITVEDQVKDHGKLVISGKYEILKFRSSNDPYGKAEKYIECDIPIILYAYYTDFFDMYEELRAKVGKNYVRGGFN